jgi:DNA-binding CsgD family transcriptional regulator
MAVRGNVGASSGKTENSESQRGIGDHAEAFCGHELLTGRERAVLTLIVEGESSKEIGRVLGISPRTVDFHRANILEKLGARNIADLIRVVLSRR